MFSALQLFHRRLVMLAGSLALAVTAQAATPAAQLTGLGQSWPATPNVSANVYWHVYTFTRDGIRYVQVNDLNGTVHMAVANVDGQVLVLPIGADSDRVSTPQQAQPAASTASSEVVYQDDQLKLLAKPQSGGTGWQVLPAVDANSRVETSTVAPADDSGSCNPRPGCGGRVEAQSTSQ